MRTKWLKFYMDSGMTLASLGMMGLYYHAGMIPLVYIPTIPFLLGGLLVWLDWQKLKTNEKL